MTMNVLVRTLAPNVRHQLSRTLFAGYCTQPGSKDHIGSLVTGKKVVVFMKGTPDEPKCGFSNAVCQILKFHGIDKFESFDVLEDDHIRQGVKEFSNWPTIPQVYFEGEFLGGCDILLEMHKNGELVEELEKIGIRSALLDEPEKKT